MFNRTLGYDACNTNLKSRQMASEKFSIRMSMGRFKRAALKNFMAEEAGASIAEHVLMASLAVILVRFALLAMEKTMHL